MENVAYPSMHSSTPHKTVESKICEVCGRNFFRAARTNQKHCRPCASKHVMEAPKPSEYAQTAKLLDKLVL